MFITFIIHSDALLLKPIDTLIIKPPIIKLCLKNYTWTQKLGCIDSCADPRFLTCPKIYPLIFFPIKGYTFND